MRGGPSDGLRACYERGTRALRAGAARLRVLSWQNQNDEGAAHCRVTAPSTKADAEASEASDASVSVSDYIQAS
jgi:hypothetical protein